MISLNSLAASFQKHYVKFLPREKIVFVAGEVGKTTTVTSILAILSQKFKVSPKFSLHPKIEKFIIEIENPCNTGLKIKPSTLVVTTVSEQTYPSLLELAMVVPRDGIVILNWDDPHTKKIGTQVSAQVLFYGTDGVNCHIWAGNPRLVNFQLTFELNHGVERVSINSKLLGIHQIYPMLAASALAISLKIPLLDIKKGLETIEVLNHRMQPLEGHNFSIILDDTYDATPASLFEAIETLNLISARRRIVVLGPMEGLGNLSEKYHRQAAQKIYKDKLDLVFLGGGDAKYIADELIRLGFIKERMQQNLSNNQIVSQLLKILAKGDVVLLKGARGVRLDEVVKRISKK